MQRRKLLILALLSFAGIGCAFYFTESLSGPKTTPEDWSKPKVLKNEGAKLDQWYLLHLLPVLKANEHAVASGTSVQNRRTQDGSIVTTIWSSEFRRSLEVDWASKETSIQEPRTDSGTRLNQWHDDQNRVKKYNVTFGYADPAFAQGPRISIFSYDDLSNVTHIPFDLRTFKPIRPFMVADYPIIAFPQILKVGGLDSIMLVDKDKKEIVGIFPRHPEAVPGYPWFALDTKNDVLLVTDFCLCWMMAIDLRTPKRN